MGELIWLAFDGICPSPLSAVWRRRSAGRRVGGRSPGWMEAARRAQVPDLGALRPVSWSAGDSEAQALFLKIAGPFGQLGFALLEKHQKEWKAKPLKLVPCASSYALLCLCLANLLNLCRFGRLLQLMFVNMHLLCSVDVVCLPIMAGLFFQPEVEISRVPRPRSLGFRLRKTVLLLLYIYLYIVCRSS